MSDNIYSNITEMLIFFGATQKHMIVTMFLLCGDSFLVKQHTAFWGINYEASNVAKNTIYFIPFTVALFMKFSGLENVLLEF